MITLFTRNNVARAFKRKCMRAYNLWFIGRRSERKALSRGFDSGGVRMTVIYGCRRLGKSELIKEFIRDRSVREASVLMRYSLDGLKVRHAIMLWITILPGFIINRSHESVFRITDMPSAGGVKNHKGRCSYERSKNPAVWRFSGSG